MITNKEDFTKKRKTRLEALEERILNAEKLIEELNKELKEEGKKELTKFEQTLNELRDMKNTILEEQEKSKMNLDSAEKEVLNESMLLINTDKVRIENKNEELLKEKKELTEYIKRLHAEIMKKDLEIQIKKKQENDLLEQNAEQEDKIRVLRSKAYGYDIAKKFEIHQNKLKNENEKKAHKLIEDEKLAYNFWERENMMQMKNPTKLDDLSKNKQLWINNPTSNIEKLMYDIDTNKVKSNSNIIQSPYGNIKSKENNLGSNMRKYSPMILNNNK
jgi:hypothetical protein